MLHYLPFYIIIHINDIISSLTAHESQSYTFSYTRLERKMSCIRVNCRRKCTNI